MSAWDLIKHILKDYAEIAAYCSVGISVFCLLIHGFNIFADQTQTNEEIFKESADACFRFQLQSLSFWTFMAVASIIFQVLFR